MREKWVIAGGNGNGDTIWTTSGYWIALVKGVPHLFSLPSYW